MDSTPIIVAKHLSKSFCDVAKVEVFKNVSLTVHSKESIAITGPSGVGKSTLLHILGTIERPSHGTLEIAGKNALATDSACIRNQHIGFVFQNFNLLPDYTALENVLMPGKIARKKTSSSLTARAYQLLEKVGLSHRARHLARSLSGGEKQRIAIARALYNDPDVLLADEPSGNLDDHQSQVMHTLLMDLTQQMGKAVVIVTHNRALASLCHRRYILTHAELQEIGSD